MTWPVESLVVDGNDGSLVVIHYSGDADEARRLLAEAIKNDPDRVYMLVPGNWDRQHAKEILLSPSVR